MDTKGKILKEALLQFNQKGIEHATIRSIADAIDISHSNLCYHYKNIDAIIDYFCHELVDEFIEQFEATNSYNSNLELLYHSTYNNFTIMAKYKFLFLDINNIIRRLPSTKIQYQELTKMRLEQSTTIISHLIEEDVLRYNISKKHYDHLPQLFLMLGDNWLSNAEIHFEKEANNKIYYYTNLLMQLLIPYYTPKGYRLLDDINEHKRSLATL